MFPTIPSRKMKFSVGPGRRFSVRPGPGDGFTVGTRAPLPRRSRRGALPVIWPWWTIGPRFRGAWIGLRVASLAVFLRVRWNHLGLESDPADSRFLESSRPPPLKLRSTTAGAMTVLAHRKGQSGTHPGPLANVPVPEKLPAQRLNHALPLQRRTPPEGNYVPGRRGVDPAAVPHSVFLPPQRTTYTGKTCGGRRNAGKREEDHDGEQFPCWGKNPTPPRPPRPEVSPRA